MKNQDSISVLQEKLAYLRSQEAIASDAAQRFKIGKDIQQTKSEIEDCLSKSTQESNPHRQPSKHKKRSKSFILAGSIMLLVIGGLVWQSSQVNNFLGFEQVTQAEMKPQADISRIHYKKTPQGDFLKDGQGRMVVDFVESFTVDAQVFTVIEHYVLPVVEPIEPGEPIPSVPRHRQPLLVPSEFHKEAIRQQQRDSLFPSFRGGSQ